jgi:hypothetical protein
MIGYSDSVQQRNDFLDAPNMLRNASFHRRRERTMACSTSRQSLTVKSFANPSRSAGFGLAVLGCSGIRPLSHAGRQVRRADFIFVISI